MESDTYMQSSKERSICRTCSQISEDVHPLCKSTDRFPLKTLSDLLLEIARIDTKADSIEIAPMNMCSTCSKKLQDAYTFVLLAQETNKKLLQLCKGSKNELEQSATVSKYFDCLLETPIDIPSNTEGYINIKLEPDNIEYSLLESNPASDDVYNNFEDDFMNTANTMCNQQNGCPSNNSRQNSNIYAKEECFESEINMQSLSDADNEEKVDPITLSSVGKKQPSSTSDSSDSDRKAKSKRRPGRPRRAENKPDCKGRFSCEECSKTFAWKKDKYRHMLSHSSTPGYSCELCDKKFIRKDKLKDHIKVHQRHSAESNECSSLERRKHHSGWSFAKQLYCYKSFKQIECKLCSNSYETIKILKNHFFEHIDDTTFVLTKDSQIIKEFYSQTTETLDEIKFNICNDLTKRRYGKYCAIVNENGYEMCLSDSDADDSLTVSKYTCEKCMEKFAKKSQTFMHIQEHHAFEKVPYKCTVCKVEFICKEIFEAHSRTQCKNKEKKYQCLKCPGKFMWLENLNGHNCSNRFNSIDNKSKLNKRRELFQCNVCSKTFVLRKDLKRHKIAHESNGNSHKCSICLQVFLKPQNLRFHLKQAHMQLNRIIECSLCGEKFGKLSQLRLHLPLHSDGFTSINIKKAVDDNYCKPNGCKQIQCMICFSKHTKIADLRTHLRTHQYAISLSQHKDKDFADVSKLLYPDEPIMMQENLIDRIIMDVAEQRLDRFYSITNEVGYELNISDSETESDSEEEEIEVETKQKHYSCDLCGETFRRKYKVFEHQKCSHDWAESPYACEICDSRFLSEKFLHKHLIAQCKNTLKKFMCKKCPLKFMWKDNLKIHERILHSEIGESTSNLKLNRYECEVCRHVFSGRKELRRHSATHQANPYVFKCLWCPRKFYHKDDFHVHIKRHDISPQCLAAAEAHIRSSNGPNGKKNITCKVCNLQFLSIFALRTHIRENTVDSHKSKTELGSN